MRAALVLLVAGTLLVPTGVIDTAMADAQPARCPEPPAHGEDGVREWLHAMAEARLSQDDIRRCYHSAVRDDEQAALALARDLAVINLGLLKALVDDAQSTIGEVEPGQVDSGPTRVTTPDTSTNPGETVEDIPDLTVQRNTLDEAVTGSMGDAIDPGDEDGPAVDPGIGIQPGAVPGLDACHASRLWETRTVCERARDLANVMDDTMGDAGDAVDDPPFVLDRAPTPQPRPPHCLQVFALSHTPTTRDEDPACNAVEAAEDAVEDPPRCHDVVHNCDEIVKCGPGEGRVGVRNAMIIELGCDVANPCATMLPACRSTLLTLAQLVEDASEDSAQILDGDGENGGSVLQDAERSTQDARGSNDVLPAADAQMLSTNQADGRWQLSLAPGLQSPASGGPPGARTNAQPPTGDTRAGCEDCTYILLPLEIPDDGMISQPASYTSSNPWVATPYIDEPPTFEYRRYWDVENCMPHLASLGVTVVMAIASKGRSLEGAGSLGIDTTIEGVATHCPPKEESNFDPGRWAARGNYRNCWGCDARTGWDGEILNVQGLIKVTSSVDLDNQFTPPLRDISTATPEGWNAQRRAYQERDLEARTSAWTAHNWYGPQLDQTSHAEIRLEVSLVTELGEAFHSVARIQASQIDTTSEESQQVIADEANIMLDMRTGLYYFVADCLASCADDPLIRITSPGAGELTPTAEGAELTFAGTPGKAKVWVGPLGFEALTLDGAFEGEGAAITKP